MDPHIEKAVERARARYEQLGISDVLSGPRTSFGQLSEALERIEAQIPNIPCRLFPTSFDADDAALRALPVRPDWKWESCEAALRSLAASGVMMRLPLFWQLEAPLHGACRSAHVPIFVNDPENMPLGSAALKDGGVDAVVTTERDAFAFSLHLDEKNVPYPSWLIIHEPRTEWRIPASLEASDAKVAREVHLFPGVPALTQCEALHAAKEARFHACEEFIWEFEDAPLLTSARESPFPLVRYAFPVSLRESGTCGCGKATYSRA